MEPAVLPRPVGHSRPIRVLVVDDNAGFRESLLSLLEAGNLQVVGEAGSGAEALGLVRSLTPDVVLMDVRMPTMDGIEATRLLKADFPDLGVVALSGHEDQEIVRGMLVAGASGYVLKDSDGDEILTAVTRAAEGGALLSSQVTPRVIEELTEALERERRRIQDLEAAQAALVERSARRQQLVARLSHELRTPVTVILGVAQTLSEVGASPTNLNRGVAGRVLEELVDNALRFSGATTGVEITISTGAAAIEVRVVDEGPGIDPREHERVFGPLEQLEELNVRVHQGVGMGLALARTAARAMGGDVVIESSSAAGSTFLWTIALTS